MIVTIDLFEAITLAVLGATFLLCVFAYAIECIKDWWRKRRGKQD